MADTSNRNKLGYTNLTYDDIESKLLDVLQKDDKTKNFMQSSLAKVILDNFLASCDLTNYYIERTAEESFLETAKHLSSVILGAQQIGYVPRRPTGAKVNIQVSIADPDRSLMVGDRLVIDQIRNTMTLNGKSFVFPKSYYYDITQEDYDAFQVGQPILINYSDDREGQGATSSPEPLYAIQGEAKIIRLYPGTLAGQKWQQYKIDHPEFSNYYGDEDIAQGEWIENNGTENYIGSPRSLTRVAVVSDENDDGTYNGDIFLDLMNNNISNTEYHVNRRSLFVDDFVSKLVEKGVEQIPACLIKTNKDTTVDLLFGEGNTLKAGPGVGEHVIVKYLATEGASANETGVVGKNCQVNGTFNFLTQHGANNEVRTFTGTISVVATSNIYGGADFEDIQSIRYNAPKVFAALDRLVTKSDYEAYLRSLTSPIKVNYAQAWGEAEECRRRGVTSVKDFCNKVLFTVIGSPYYKEGDNWEAVELMNSSYVSHNDTGASDLVFVEGSDANYRTSAYFDYFVNDGKTNSTSGSDVYAKVQELNKTVDSKSQLTVLNSYIPPYVHGFTIKGKIILNEFAELGTAQRKIQNAIYSFLNSTSVVNTPIYTSDITNIIENINEVKNSNIWFEPIAVKEDETGIITDFNNIFGISGSYDVMWDFLYKYCDYQTIYPDDYNNPNVSEFVPTEDSYRYDITTLAKNVQASLFILGYGTKTSDEGYTKNIKLVKNLDVYHIYAVLFRSLWEWAQRNNISSAIFINAMKQLAKEYSLLLDYSMLDENGNITHFSVDNEMTMIYFDKNIVGY